MGKKGELLRAAKKENKTYTFTTAQLEAHDAFVIDQKRDEIKRKLTAEMEERYKEKEAELSEYIKKEWEERENLFKGDSIEDGFFNLLSMLLCVSSSVLVKKFHWKPIPKDTYWDKRNKLAQFGDALVEEVNSICNDEMADLRRYMETCFEEYGVKFIRTTEEAEEQSEQQ